MPMEFLHICETIAGIFLRHGYMINSPSTYYVGLGIESRRGVRFSVPVYTGPGVKPAPCTTGTWSISRRVKRPGSDFDHSPHLAPKLKKE